MAEDDLPRVNVGDIDNAPTSLPLEDRTISMAQHQKVLTAFADVSRKYEELLLKNNFRRNDHKAAKKLNKLIEPFANKIYDFMCGYCGVVATFIACDPFLKLPDKVLEIMVGSTAVTVFGLIGTVLTGIFMGARSKGSGNQ